MSMDLGIAVMPQEQCMEDDLQLFGISILSDDYPHIDIQDPDGGNYPGYLTFTKYNGGDHSMECKSLDPVEDVLRRIFIEIMGSDDEYLILDTAESFEEFIHDVCEEIDCASVTSDLMQFLSDHPLTDGLVAVITYI